MARVCARTVTCMSVCVGLGVVVVGGGSCRGGEVGAGARGKKKEKERRDVEWGCRRVVLVSSVGGARVEFENTPSPRRPQCLVALFILLKDVVFDPWKELDGEVGKGFD